MPEFDAKTAFDEWWDAYPHKVSKKQARERFLREIKKPEQVEALMENTALWAAYWEEPFIPYPATFLHRGQWEAPPPAKRQRLSRDDQRRQALFDAAERIAER